MYPHSGQTNPLFPNSSYYYKQKASELVLMTSPSGRQTPYSLPPEGVLRYKDSNVIFFTQINSSSRTINLVVCYVV